jgi:hypothetical protein
MAEPNVGLRQARRLAEMSPVKRLEFIAEGLPVILDSAAGFLRASKELTDHKREADVLRGFAEEEAAKALILIDIIRCPPKLVSQKLPTMIRWFYDHLARLLYAKASYMRPVTTTQLQEYVDHDRRTHFLDGDYGEYIMPNSEIFSRESRLYADIAAYEDRELFWNAPRDLDYLIPRFDPEAYLVVDALAAVGVFSKQGLAIAADVWGGLEFRSDVGVQEGDQLVRETMKRLIEKGLPREDASNDHVRMLYGSWQFPMYNIELGRIAVSIDELVSQRDRIYPYEY